MPKRVAMRRFAALLSFLVALAAFQLTDSAAAACQTFGPSGDTYVNEARPKRHLGSAKRLFVRAGSRSAREAYVRFDVAGLAGWVSSAKLRFFVTDGTRNGPAVYQTGAWPRKPLTWKRRPDVIRGPRDDEGRVPSGHWVEWDVTPWVTRDDAYSFVLKGGSSGRSGPHVPRDEEEEEAAARRHDQRRPSHGRVRQSDARCDCERRHGGARAGAGRDRLDRCLRMRRQVGRRGSCHRRELRVVGAMGHADGRLLERPHDTRHVCIPRRRHAAGRRVHHGRSQQLVAAPARP